MAKRHRGEPICAVALLSSSTAETSSESLPEPSSRPAKLGPECVTEATKVTRSRSGNTGITFSRERPTASQQQCFPTMAGSCLRTVKRCKVASCSELQVKGHGPQPSHQEKKGEPHDDACHADVTVMSCHRREMCNETRPSKTCVLTLGNPKRKFVSFIHTTRQVQFTRALQVY